MSNTVNLKVNRSESKTNTQQWHEINWVKVERIVFKLQKRIYKAETVGDIRTVRKLQNTLTNSWYAKLLAIRIVTQDNRGRKTAGIDGVKSLNDKNRMALALKLKFSNKAKPARRVWIPKPGKTEKRPLGIPVMEDRAKQALLKFALEPQWEARSEPHSYGFRPARSCHDAIKAIYNALSIDKWVLDADIAGCFDNINHQYLLDKVDTTPKFKKQIKAWLKAGTIDWFNKPEVFSKTTQGTPQGGVLSPLLANIALHGLEEHLKDWLWNKRKYRIPEWNATKGKWGTIGQKKTKKTLSIIRYADDFVVIHKDLEIVKEAKVEINEYLKDIGLEMKEAKTQIVNSKKGFKFLGLNIRHFETGSYRSEKNTVGKATGLVRLIQPSKDSILRQYRKIADVIDSLKNASQSVLISKLNPIIRGFSNYHKYYSSTEQLEKLDRLIFRKLLRWAKRRHPNKGMKWVVKKYFFNHNNPKIKWLFGIGSYCIRKHNDTKKERYIQVKGDASIFDGNTAYWGKRVQCHPELSLRQLTLIKRQKGKCAHCDKTFKAEDIWETDRVIPRCKGGKDTYDNLQLLHAHCHDQKSRQDRKEPNTTQKPTVVVS
ncbi:RNA-directed DNA polymerase [Hyella patelloides LEGE 07179]|uniref:RNA-directed DNA polymerase n=1 Tax=Hyella patelloides LEGE 07179 TaxID=945734 RepID=A0A563VRM8_9CYAN|nr:group II intron reverse transcriptase/maturase [Hyella patelloides]VEP14035.1 RNA-directed DNA polymerase [Hyella patelloides LEGE 07179]